MFLIRPKTLKLYQELFISSALKLIEIKTGIGKLIFINSYCNHLEIGTKMHRAEGGTGEEC